MALKTAGNADSNLAWLSDPEFRTALRTHKIVNFPTNEIKPLPEPVSMYITTGVKNLIVPQFNGEDPPFAHVQASRRTRRDYPKQWQGEWRMASFDRPPARAGYKYCAACNEEVRLEGFRPRKESKDGKHSYCNDCHRLQMNRWRATAKDAA